MARVMQIKVKRNGNPAILCQRIFSNNFFISCACALFADIFNHSANYFPIMRDKLDIDLRQMGGEQGVVANIYHECFQNITINTKMTNWANQTMNGMRFGQHLRRFYWLIEIVLRFDAFFWDIWGSNKKWKPFWIENEKIRFMCNELCKMSFTSLKSCFFSLMLFERDLHLWQRLKVIDNCKLKIKTWYKLISELRLNWYFFLCIAHIVFPFKKFIPTMCKENTAQLKLEIPSNPLDRRECWNAYVLMQKNNWCDKFELLTSGSQSMLHSASRLQACHMPRQLKTAVMSCQELVIIVSFFFIARARSLISLSVIFSSMQRNWMVYLELELFDFDIMRSLIFDRTAEGIFALCLSTLS